MLHLRERHLLAILQKQAKLWPVVGLLGPRQSGKSTLFRDLLQLGEPVSLDEIAVKEEARKSPDLFLKKLSPPILIDEVQKAPELFDAIKLRVDKKKIPGSFFLTGSSGFSSKLGIRESLTGRIGISELLPLTVSELHRQPFRQTTEPTAIKPRFDLDQITKALLSGGMPVPAFLRETSQREQYWRSWIETTIFRDLAAFFPKGYDSDFAFSLVHRMAAVMKEGELPTLKHFNGPARKVRNFLSAMREIFLIRQMNCHPGGIGKEAWIFMDSGLCAYLLGTSQGEGATLSLVRHFMWNEWAAQSLYTGKSFFREYYKSAQGSPVDAVFNGIPYRIVASASDVTRRLKIEERPLLGAMKALKSKVGYLVAPVEKGTTPPKTGGVGILPWGEWS
ncbi:AAA family ATPase [Bdellovibrionota bacterium FG-2]